MPSAQVLVVDDDQAVLESLSRMLRVLGHPVQTARSAVDALTTLAATSLDVVLLDLVMPGVSGLDALPHFRQRHPGIPVVVVTAVLDPEVLQQARDLGAFDVLQKPFGVAELAEVLDRATQHRAGGGARTHARLCSRCSKPIRLGDAVTTFYTWSVHVRCLPPPNELRSVADEFYLVLVSAGLCLGDLLVASLVRLSALAA